MMIHGRLFGRPNAFLIALVSLAIVECTERSEPSREQNSVELTDVPACLSVNSDILVSDPLNACAVSEIQPIENYGHSSAQCPGKLIVDVSNVGSTPMTPYVQWQTNAFPGLSPDSNDCAGVQLNLDAYGWNGTQWILLETIAVRGTFSSPRCDPSATYSGAVVSNGVPSAITGYSRLRIVANGTIASPSLTPRNAIPIRVGFKANPGSPPNLSCIAQNTNCALPSGSCIRAFGADAPRPLPAFDIGSVAGGADRKGDILLLTANAANQLPIALSKGDGTFTALTTSGTNAATFATAAAASGAKVVAGDFDGNGTMDLALVNPTGLTQIMVAFSNGLGSFSSLTSASVPSFPSWANTTGVKVVSGDFNGDGKSDIALTGGPGWTSVPVAFSTGAGSFNVTNLGADSFPTYATYVGAKAIAGDFNGDGKSDIALAGGSLNGVPWKFFPVAFSKGDGSFRLSNSNSSMPGSGYVPVEGDFDGDGFSDIAFVGKSGVTSIFVAFSLGNKDGQFTATQTTVPLCPGFASTAGAKPVSGDFNNDGRDDIAWVGVGSWTSIPIAYGQSTRGTFTCPALVNDPSASMFLQFSTQANVLPVRLVAGN